ncbi:hypothetical protein [Phaeodactylibacter xiamenensis]|uniref:hypothetical protein n=1 Tax=Phaeodactylibacter xiamenensis TaxID=1524460 RepID=UPI0024A86CE3|nr:hypothetical protein [Phaeodactylibacter xiamenensis]
MNKNHVFLFLMLMAPILTFSQNSLMISEEGINGLYEGVVKRDHYRGGKNKVEILLYKPIVAHKGYRGQKKIEYIYGVRKQYSNKKGKGVPDLIYFAGIINSLSSRDKKIQLSNVEFFKPSRLGLEEVRGVRSFPILKIGNGNIAIHDLAYGATLEKQKGNVDSLNKMVNDFFGFRLSQCKNQTGILIGQVEPRYSGYNRTPRSGLDVFTLDMNGEELVTAEELQVGYQTKVLFPKEETSYSVAKSLMKSALLSGACKLDLQINLMPLLKRISVYDPESREKHFEVSILRGKSSIQLDIRETNEGKLFGERKREELTTQNQLEEEKKEKARIAKIEAEKAGGVNPSGETLDFSGTANSVVSEIKKVFYGKFDQVNEFMFKNRMHNSFLIYASSLHGKYSSDLITVSFSVNEEEKTNGITTNKRNLDYNIWMEPRFEKSFNDYLQHSQVSVLNAFSWGATFEYFFKKYPPDSIVFKQLKENIYRYSKNLPPAESLNGIP